MYRKLTLLSAPAGYGKTTLVSEWVSNLRLDAEKEGQTAIRIAWLSLDESDQDSVRFLTYLVAALMRAEAVKAAIGEVACGMLQSPQPPPAQDVLTTLINEVATLPGRIILVLDDYHIFESSQVDKAITFLLEHLPPQMHLVIATRQDPHLPLALLRARDQLTELRAADLRFTSSEAAEFLDQAMGLDLSPQEIARLESRTEGWIAGLQLAALSIQGNEDGASLIRTFTGSHRLVLDFLIEEVLSQQSESIQRFLLQTSILDQLTGSLCNALTGLDEGPTTLEYLEHSNLFIVPLDDERRWYRYHHLFADLLHERLRQTQSKHLPVLHLRASEWYEQNGLVDEAIEHALHAQDFERAARQIESQIDVAWARGEYARLRRWLVALPVALILSRPHLCIFHALYLFTTGQRDVAERSLQVAQRALEPDTDRIPESSPPEQESQLSDTDRMKLRGRLAAIRAFIVTYSQVDYAMIIQYARQALEYLPKQDLTMRTIAAIALGDAYALKGEIAAAYQAQLEALETSKLAGNNFLIVANLKVANILREQGRLERTIEVCRRQMQLVDKNGLSQTGMVGWLLALWGEALAELNNLEGAIDLVRKGAELTERSGEVAMLGWSYLCLMRVLFSMEDWAGAEEIIQKTRKIGRESKIPPWLTNQMAAWQARLWLAQGKLEAASQWVEVRGLSVGVKPRLLHEIDFFTLIEYIVLARILIAQEQLDEASGLLQWLFEAAERRGRTTRVIEILLLQALAFQARGAANRASTALERALTLAEPGGFIRIFVDEGPSMARLLYEAFDRGIAPDYVIRLLQAFPIDEPEPVDRPQSHSSQSGYIAPLSEREIEVLQLISEGLTNPEIATILILSLHTVKTHTRNIYGKLGAHNRTQAVARARVFGVLPFQA